MTQSAGSSQPVLSIERFRWSVRLDTLFFPLRPEEVLDLAQELGFRATREWTHARAVLRPGSGGVLTPEGVIGLKDESSGRQRLLTVDGTRSILGIDGTVVKEVLDDFEKFARIAAEKQRVQLVQDARFFEYILDGFASSPYDPLKTIEYLQYQKYLQDRINEIVGFSAVNYGVRLVHVGYTPQSDIWTDYRLEPLPGKPNTTYLVSMVMRDKSMKLVKQSAMTIEDRVIDLIRAISIEA